MDLVLDVADSYVFDAVYAKLLPVDALRTVNASVAAAIPAASQWSKIASMLPRPIVGLKDASPVLTPPLYASAWPRDYLPRQILSLSVLTLVGIHLLYFLIAGLSYKFIFNHEMRKHPRFLKDQEKLEIQSSLRAFPGITLMTLPWFLLFTDYCIYWIHRWLHVPFIYKRLHKPHHKWIIPTPFASHAFHPVDGYLQSVPYHLFVFLFPLHRVQYLGLFVFVNIWSIFIHDSDMIVGHPLEKVINGPAHHTLHHIYFTVNYGQVTHPGFVHNIRSSRSQYFTWADRVGNSYRQPESHLDPLLEVQALQKAKSE
ncbi:Fatty acid hydroxylase [Mycena kentingensis (nom. inval.)]|nr:Fatty acid hydroxylase [Mycena kentingensis (nom. inval.)]